MTDHEYPTIAITTNEFQAPGIDAVGGVERQFSDENPALIRLGLQNKTSEERILHTGVPLPFPGFSNDEGDVHGMYLLTEDEKGFLQNRNGDPIIPEHPDKGCWRIQPTGGHGQTQVGFSLAPGELYESDYVVLAPADADACLPAGDYHFTAWLKVESAGGKYDWRLTVSVR
jgi:hypothetical protein